MLDLVHIKATTLPDAWFQCVSLVLDRGYQYEITKGSYEGQTRFEFDYVDVHITHPGSLPLIPDMPPGIGIPPPTTIEYVHQYLPYLMGNDVKPDETYTYGERIIGKKPREGKDGLVQPVNQMQLVIDMFKSTGEGTNQATIEIARPEDCGTVDPPCVRLIDCRLRYGALHFFVYVRSWDLWGGFPVNLATIQMMKEYMAGEIGCEDGEIIAMSKGLHIYGYAEELAKLRTGRKIK